ncbi:DUF4178 domain-containing protein [Bacillus tianshenii]|nr:DUF4178 domain-containing protein [Bacillus tianshenii]
MSLFKRLFQKEKEVPKVEERNVFNIKVGDIVTYDLVDYQVVGTLSYNDHGFQWFAYQLQGTNETIWLSAEMDDQLELCIYKHANLKLTTPLPEKLEYDGVTYYLDEKGTANVRGEGRGRNVSGMTIQYYDYCDDEEEQFLSVEVWGSEVEVSYGFEIEEMEVKILAGS